MALKEHLMWSVLLKLTFLTDVGFSQRLPPYGNLHPLNFGESHCGPDISLNKADQSLQDQVSQFKTRNRLNQHLIYRDSNFFNRKRWDTGLYNVGLFLVK